MAGKPSPPLPRPAHLLPCRSAHKLIKRRKALQSYSLASPCCYLLPKESLPQLRWATTQPPSAAWRVSTGLPLLLLWSFVGGRRPFHAAVKTVAAPQNHLLVGACTFTTVLLFGEERRRQSLCRCRVFLRLPHCHHFPLLTSNEELIESQSRPPFPCRRSITNSTREEEEGVGEING